MEVDRALGDEEFVRDFFIAQPFGDEVQDFELSTAELHLLTPNTI